MYIHICIYIQLYINVCIYIYVYMYMYISIHIHTYTGLTPLKLLSPHGNMLHHTATRCNKLHHIHCNTLLSGRSHFKTCHRHVATCCRALQHKLQRTHRKRQTATHKLQHTNWNTPAAAHKLQQTATNCNTGDPSCVAISEWYHITTSQPSATECNKHTAPHTTHCNTLQHSTTTLQNSTTKIISATLPSLIY